MIRPCAALLLLVPLLTAVPAAGELLYFAEDNRLRVIDIASLSAPPRRERILVENADTDPRDGRDINGTICALPDGSGRFVAGEDTGQPHPPAGWGVLDAEGRQVGKLVATAGTSHPEPYGCAFDRRGRLFSTEIGDPGFRRANGQLIVWFPPFDRFPGEPGAYPRTDAVSDHFCKIATDLGTPSGIAIDAQGRVYVAAASRMQVLRFSPPFPTAPDAAGGCGRRDARGSPLADVVRREVILGPQLRRGMLTYSGLALSPGGNLYAASVATGRIAEYSPDGEFVRMVLQPSEWIPPFRTGTPQGLAVDARGTLYYADLDLVRRGLGLEPGPDGKVWRIRFDARGEPLAPEMLAGGLRFPDGLGVLAGDLERRAPEGRRE